MKLRNLCLPLVLTITGTNAATWNGGGTDNNWSTALNWGGTAPVNGNPLIFSGTNRQTNINNSLTGIGALSFTSRGWNITGNDVALGGDVTFLTTSAGTGDVVWGINTELTATRKIQVDNVVGGALDITGLISGTGGLTRGTTGGTSDGTLRLSNSGNTFGGPVTLDGGITEVVGLADSGFASSLGQGGTITLGTTASNFAATLRFVGSGSTATDRALSLNFRQNLSVQTLTNNSSGNGDLTFSSSAAVAMVNNNSTVDGSGNSSGILTFNGSSTGLTTFAGLLQDNPLDSRDILSIAKSGSGTLVLTNANTYTGGTTIATGGTVRATDSSALGSGAVTAATGGALALDGGISIANALSLGATTGTGALVSQVGANTVSGNITLTGTGTTATISNTDSAGVSLTLSGTLDLNSNSLNLAGKNRQLTLSGKITGTAGKINIQSTTGNVTLSNDTSDFKAAIETGFNRNLQFTSITNVGGGASALGAPTNTTEGTITFKNGNSFTRFEYIGTSAAVTDRILKMGGNGGALILVNSSGTKLTYTADLARDATSTGGLEISPNVGSTIEFAGKLSDGASATALSLNLTGAGSTILSGNNTYTGTTTVNSGASLAINGNHTGGGLTTVNGTLSGSGSLGAANVTGVLSPGNSIESLATGDLAMLTGSTLSYELQDTSATGADLVAVTGDLSLSGTVTLDLVKLGTGGWSVNDKLTLLGYTGAWNNGLFTFEGNLLADDSSFTFDGATWAFDYNDTLKGNNFAPEAIGNYVTITVVPEPAAALLGAFGLLAMLRRRR